MAIEVDQAAAAAGTVAAPVDGGDDVVLRMRMLLTVSVQLQLIALNCFPVYTWNARLRIYRALNNPLANPSRSRGPFVPLSLSSHHHDPPQSFIIYSNSTIALDYRTRVSRTTTAYYSGRGLFIDTTLHLHPHLQLYRCSPLCPLSVLSLSTSPDAPRDPYDHIPS